MNSLGRHIALSIEAAEAGKASLALQHAAISIDITAQRFKSGGKSKPDEIEQLLTDYLWLVDMMMMEGEGQNRGSLPLPALRHAVRLGLVYADGAPSNVVFSKEGLFEIGMGKVVLPRRLIWALVAVAVFCRCNIGDHVNGRHWLAMFGNRFVIDQFFGQEDIARIVHAHFLKAHAPAAA